MKITKEKLKAFISGMVVTVLLISGIVMAEGISQTIDVVMNGINLVVNGQKMNKETILYNGTTYVPLRAVSEILGKKVDYEAITNTASVRDIDYSSLKDNSRNKPAKVGEKFLVDFEEFFDGTHKFEVTMTDIISGYKALEIMKLINKEDITLNENQEYVLAKFKYKELESKDHRPLVLTKDALATVKQEEPSVDRTFLNPILNPNFNVSLYEGSEYEGWVHFIVDKGDKAYAVIDRAHKTSEIWFDLRSK